LNRRRSSVAIERKKAGLDPWRTDERKIVQKVRRRDGQAKGGEARGWGTIAWGTLPLP